MWHPSHATRRDEVALQGCDVVAVRDGCSESCRIYYDRLAMMTQLGLAPEETATT